MKRGILILTGAILLGIIFISNRPSDYHNNIQSNTANSEIEKAYASNNLKYGYDPQHYFFDPYPVKSGMVMSNILSSFNVDYKDILKLEQESKNYYSLRKIRAGKYITFVKESECADPIGFIYNLDDFNYIDYRFKDDEFCIQYGEVPYSTEVMQSSGIITSTLSESMMDQGLSLAMIDELEDALAQVYFPHAQRGDQYRVIYEQKMIEGNPVGTGKILAASYKRGESESFGFFYANDRYEGYYDENGAANKRTFLRAPVKASRISSRYNLNRLHPVLKVRRPHLGTDYAAPRGTPIFSVADGVITKRGFTRGNGNYVKIRHDGTYESQYLHMNRFRSGHRVGTRVKQGEVIGYVGKTGLATGYHVCFRFWKNGRQVDHLRENFPPLNPMEKSELPSYYEVRDSLMRELQNIPYPNATADLSEGNELQS